MPNKGLLVMGYVGAIILPGAAMGMALTSWVLGMAEGSPQYSVEAVLFGIGIVFAAGGCFVQLNSMQKKMGEMVTKDMLRYELAELKSHLRDTYQTQDGCEERHNNLLNGEHRR